MTISLASLGGGVKSVQRGSTILNSVLSATETITSVDLTKSFLVMTSTTSSATLVPGLARGQITDATTLTFTKGASGGTTVVEWQVVEYN